MDEENIARFNDELDQYLDGDKMGLLDSQNPDQIALKLGERLAFADLSSESKIRDRLRSRLVELSTRSYARRRNPIVRYLARPGAWAAVWMGVALVVVFSIAWVLFSWSQQPEVRPQRTVFYISPTVSSTSPISTEAPVTVTLKSAQNLNLTPEVSASSRKIGRVGGLSARIGVPLYQGVASIVIDMGSFYKK